MRPPICDLCGKDIDYKSNSSDYLIKFSDHEELPPHTVGHPKGLLWFCDEHVNIASKLSHLSSTEALDVMRKETKK